MTNYIEVVVCVFDFNSGICSGAALTYHISASCGIVSSCCSFLNLVAEFWARLDADGKVSPIQADPGLQPLQGPNEENADQWIMNNFVGKCDDDNDKIYNSKPMI